MNCSVWKNLPNAQSFINWCPMRKVYVRVSSRINHDRYIRTEKGRKVWNTYLRKNYHSKPKR